VQSRENFFHLHLISDATGETLMTVARASAVQFAQTRAVEHVHALVRTEKQLSRVLSEIEAEPGIVLYTLVDRALSEKLEAHCHALGIEPIFQVMQSYLGAASDRRIGAQHTLDADYFHRIDALNFTMMHDDGQLAGRLEDADVVLVGVSRTSKTPTSIYLANRGIRTANVPLVPNIPLPPDVENIRKPLVIGLVASPERIIALRENRILSLNASQPNLAYTDKASVADEISYTRKLCAKHGWPVIDVTRRSIEETAAAIMALHREHREARDAGPGSQ
jgi:regulator of PEP synthase PpsR (kinase-PPPase family)